MKRNIYLAGAMSCYFNTDKHDYPKEWREEAKEYVKKLYDDITMVSPIDFYRIRTITILKQKLCDLI
jgi:hypothetical protein